MDPWEFGWSAIAAIGQALGAIITSIAVYIALRPLIRRININLIYLNEAGSKTETLYISNECSRTITLIEMGVVIKRGGKKHVIKFEEHNILFYEVPITLTSGNSITITEYTHYGETVRVKEFYNALFTCLVPKVYPYPDNIKIDPKVYFYAKDSRGKAYKNYIGKRSELLNMFKKNLLNRSI